jgi:hypothetical protein
LDNEGWWEGRRDWDWRKEITAWPKGLWAGCGVGRKARMKGIAYLHKVTSVLCSKERGTKEEDVGRSGGGKEMTAGVEWRIWGHWL